MPRSWLRGAVLLNGTSKLAPRSHATATHVAPLIVLPSATAAKTASAKGDDSLQNPIQSVNRASSQAASEAFWANGVLLQNPDPIG